MMEHTTYLFWPLVPVPGSVPTEYQMTAEAGPAYCDLDELTEEATDRGCTIDDDYELTIYGQPATGTVVALVRDAEGEPIAAVVEVKR